MGVAIYSLPQCTEVLILGTPSFCRNFNLWCAGSRFKNSRRFYGLIMLSYVSLISGRHTRQQLVIFPEVDFKTEKVPTLNDNSHHKTTVILHNDQSSKIFRNNNTNVLIHCTIVDNITF